MEPIATPQTKIFFTVFLFLVLLSLGFTYYKYIVQKDFVITTEEV